MKTTRIVLTIPEEHGDALRAEARRLRYDSPQNLIYALLRGEVELDWDSRMAVMCATQVMKSINIPPATPGRKKGKQ